MQFSCKIFDIKSGWLIFHLNHNESGVSVKASNVTDFGAPGKLLQSLWEMLDKDNDRRVLTWDHETGRHIWHFESETGNLLLELYHSRTVYLHFDRYAQRHIARRHTIEKMRYPEKTEKRELLFHASLPLYEFVRKVKNAFSIYSTRENLKVYEKEWGRFPFRDFNKLKEKLKEVRGKSKP